MQETGLIDRLNAMRRTVRQRLLVYGLSSVLAGGIAAFLAIVVIDWLLWLPAGLRLLVGAIFLGGFVAAVAWWVVRPARARLGVDEIAGKLERHFADLQDRLSSTVNFLTGADAGSPALMQRVIGNTERIVKSMALESALTMRPLAWRLASLALATVVMLATLLAAPSWARTGFHRYANPLGETEWPRSVAIAPITGSQTVALGESVTVRMAVERGGHDALRGVVRIRERDGKTVTRAMQRDLDGSYYATIDAVTDDLNYWFEAGDDTTQRKPFTLRVVRRPAVVEALATVEPPSYAVNRAVRTQDLADGPVTAPMGGFIHISVSTSKPIPADPAGETVGLRLESGDLLPLAVDPTDPTILSTGFEVTGDAFFRIELVDEHGFENRGALQHAVRAVADAVPTATIVEPRSTVEITPRGAFRVLVRATDDFGLSTLELQAERLGGEASWTFALTESMVPVGGTEGVEAVADYLWDVAPLSLSPGDVLRYAALATDNLIIEGGGGQIGRSPFLRLTIISDVEFDARVRDEIAVLERGIREAAFEEAELLDETMTLLRKEADPPGLTDLERDRAVGLGARQARMIRRMDELADRFARLGGRMAQNQSGSEETRRHIAGMGDSLEQVAAGTMTTASDALSRSGEPVPGARQQELLSEARTAEADALERLEAMIQGMSQWGSFQGLVAKTRDLRDRQERVRESTVELGKSMLGKPVESLDADEKEALTRVERRQNQLAKDAEQLLARMRQLLDEAAEKDEAAAEAIDAALRTAQARDLNKRLRGAADAVGQNRTAAAAIDQKAAAEALRKIEEALRERERRELALLRKRLTGAEEQVAELIEQQRAIRAATHEAGQVAAPDQVLPALEEEQRTLRRNTRQVGDDLADVESAASSARSVQAAVAPMERAEGELHGQRAEPAVVAQDEALTLLEEALAGLEELSRKMEEESFQRTLAQIREHLAAVREAQVEVNGGIAELQATMEAQGGMSRTLAREASKLARGQSSVQELLHELMPELDKVPVFEWALGRVAGWMETSRNWLTSRKIDDDLILTAGRIVRELDKLIQAIVDTQGLPTESEFAEAEGAGGEGKGMTLKPVPTVTELLLLKAMQADINQRTESLSESLNIEEADESQLRELTIVAEDQVEVRRLTEKVTAKARQP